MRKKGLLNRIAKRTLPYMAAAGSMLFLSSCNEPPTKPGIEEPKETYSPTAVLNASPSEGYAPLETRLECSGEHPEGVENIEKYVLKNGLGGEIESDSPIKIEENFANPGKYNAECFVYSGEKNDSKKELLSVYDPGRPKATLNIDKKDGQAPLRSNISLSGEHPENIDIAEYHLKIDDKNYTEKSAIEMSEIFSHPRNYSVAGWVIDSNGESSDTLETTLKVDDIETFFERVDDINLKYSASFGDMTPTLKIFRDGEQNPIIEKEISRGVEETFNYTEHGITKGNYTAVLEPNNSDFNHLEKENAEEIPNYAPNFDPSGLNTEFDEEGNKTINLEDKISDKNPEDTPFISNVISDEKTKVDIGGEGYTLTISGKEDQYGNFQNKIEISDGHGGNVEGTLSGYIHPWARVSGVVRNVESEGLAGEQSIIKVYDEDWKELESGNTDSQGNFKIKVKERASSLDALVIQAAHGAQNNRTGYVRTETIPGDLADPESQNYNENIEIMAVPFDPYTSNPEEFKEFFEEFGFPNKFDFDGRYLKGINNEFQDFEGLERIRILKNDPCTDSEFTQEKQENIKSKILDPTDIGAITGNFKINENIIRLGNDGLDVDYSVNCDANDFSKSVLAKPGVLLYVPREPKNIEGRAGRVIPGKLSNILYAGTVLGAPWGTGPLWSHETGHIFLTSPHPTALGNTESVMPEDANSETTLRADHKAGKIIYHELGNNNKWSHFIVMDGSFPGWDSSEDSEGYYSVEKILGMDFGSENKLTRKNGKYWHGN